MSRILLAIVCTVVIVGSVSTGEVDSPSVAVKAVGTTLTATPRPEMTAYEREMVDLRRQELEETRDQGCWQAVYWCALIFAGVVGYRLTKQRIKALEETAEAAQNNAQAAQTTAIATQKTAEAALKTAQASEANTKTEHYDRMFAEYMERFADPRNTKSVRVGGVIGLGALAKVTDPLDEEQYPYRNQVVSLLIESLENHPNMAILPAIRDQLAEIGPPAIQRLVDKHRERFGSAFSDREIDPEDPAFRASRDTIASIFQVHGPSTLVSQGWLEGITVNDTGHPYLPRLNLRGADLSEVNFADAGMEGNDLTGAYLLGACLRHADLRLANLTRTHLVGADLAQARLTEADLTSAILQQANLDGASLMWVNTNNTELRDARDWQSIYSGVGSNWWDADLSDKQRAWFEKHYSRDENEPRYLEVWNADGTRKEPT